MCICYMNFGPDANSSRYFPFSGKLKTIQVHRGVYCNIATPRIWWCAMEAMIVDRRLKKGRLLRQNSGYLCFGRGARRDYQLRLLVAKVPHFAGTKLGYQSR